MGLEAEIADELVFGMLAGCLLLLVVAHQLWPREELQGRISSCVLWSLTAVIFSWVLRDVGWWRRSCEKSSS